MAAERDLELLDDYLSNRLDSEGQADFEEKMRKDPELKSEFELQQQFIEGIKKARMAELKSMLNNVPVPPASTSASIGAKAAMWIVVAGLIGTGAYFYFDKKSETTGIVPETKQEQKEKASEQHDATASDVTKTDDEEPVVSEEPSASEGKAITVPKASKKANSKSGQPALDVYDPTKESSEATNGSEDSKLVKEASTTVAVEINRDSKRDFHYQLNDGKLTLFGPFEKNLYEILEFFDGDKRTVFLYYRNQFYHLKDSGDEIKALVAVKDPALLKKLKESRTK